MDKADHLSDMKISVETHPPSGLSTVRSHLTKSYNGFVVEAITSAQWFYNPMSQK